MNRGNFRKVQRNTQRSRVRGRKKGSDKEGEKERERSFRKRPAIYETEWKRVLEGTRRPPPLIPPLNIAISTSQLHSAIPHFKGKISGRLSLHRLFDELASRTPARMENNAISCSWQLVPSPSSSTLFLKIFLRTTEIPDDPSDRVSLCIREDLRFDFEKIYLKSFVRFWKIVG